MRWSRSTKNALLSICWPLLLLYVLAYGTAMCLASLSWMNSACDWVFLLPVQPTARPNACQGLQDCLGKHQRGLLCCRRVGVWPYTIHLSYCHVAIHSPGRAMNALERQQDMTRLGLPWCWCQQKHCLCGSQPVGVLEGFLGKSERLLLQDGRRLRHGRCLQALSRTAGWWLGACIASVQSALRSGSELPGALLPPVFSNAAHI